jgi:hypothetical protein
MQEEASQHKKNGFICFLNCTAQAVFIPEPIAPKAEQAEKIVAAANRVLGLVKSNGLIESRPQKAAYDSNVFQHKHYIAPDIEYVTSRSRKESVLDEQRCILLLAIVCYDKYQPFLHRHRVQTAPVWVSFPKAPDLTEEQLVKQRAVAASNAAVDELGKNVSTKAAWRNKDDGAVYT